MREGLIPTLLGTGVTATGVALGRMNMKRSNTTHFMPMLAAGVIGFGLAHIVLGSIDLFEGRR